MNASEIYASLTPDQCRDLVALFRGRLAMTPLGHEVLALVRADATE